MKSHIHRFIGTACLMLLMAAEPAGSITAAEKNQQKEKQARGWLGVSIQDVSEETARKEKLKSEDGAYVTSVVEDSPADSAGVRDHDVIVEFAGRAIDDADDLSSAVSKTAPGTKITVVVLRGGEKKSVSVTIGKAKNLRSNVYARSFSPPLFHMPEMPSIRIAVGNAALGLRLMPLNEQLGEYFGAPNNEGVLVEEVEKKSAGEKAGFKAGDVITRFGKRTVDDVDDIQRELRKYDEDDKVDVEVLRRGTKKTLTVEIDESAADMGWKNPSEHHGGTFQFFGNEGSELIGPDQKALQLELEDMTRDLRSKQHDIQQKVRQELRSIKESAL